jgi:hypothetical protein
MQKKFPYQAMPHRISTIYLMNQRHIGTYSPRISTCRVELSKTAFTREGRLLGGMLLLFLVSWLPLLKYQLIYLIEICIQMWRFASLYALGNQTGRIPYFDVSVRCMLRAVQEAEDTFPEYARLLRFEVGIGSVNARDGKCISIK